MSSDRMDDVPSAIIGSGFCCSVVSEQALDWAVESVGRAELEDEDIYQKVHLFGRSKML